MKNNFRRLFILLYVAVCMSMLESSCTPGSSSIPKTGNKTLDSLLTSVPATIINLKNKPVDTLFAKKKNFWGTRSADSLHTTLTVFGSVVGMVKIGSRLYVADQRRHCIWVINSRGAVIQKIGRKGKGPGEFIRLTGIIKISIIFLLQIFQMPAS